MFYGPSLAGWDLSDSSLVNPILAAEAPSVQNGGLAADAKSVTWKLKPGVKWHDGKPFTADDVLFTWEYAKNPDTAAVTVGSYKDIKVEKLDDYSVKITFNKPTPFWADAFVGSNGMILPKHIFADYAGGKSREAPANLKPVGTGPYLFVDFKPGDMVQGKLNPDYHVPNRPYFDTLEIKGGGDAVSAARAVLQTGEYDYAWNMQVEDEILIKLEAAKVGSVNIQPTGNVEFIMLNSTDPSVEVDGERASVKTKHPLFSDPAVREAINLLIDRGSIEKFIYGRTAVATANFLNNPERFRSTSTKFEFNIEKANQILEAAGWKKGSDGVRTKDGKAAEIPVPDFDQRAAPEDSGHHQAGLPEGGHRDRAEVGGRLGVLLIRHGQPGHVRALLLRRADVHPDDDAARSADLHEPAHVMGDRQQGQQVAGPQLFALAEQGVRRSVPRGREGARSGQARGDVCQDERNRRRRSLHPAGGLSAARDGVQG